MTVGGTGFYATIVQMIPFSHHLDLPHHLLRTHLVVARE